MSTTIVYWNQNFLPLAWISPAAYKKLKRQVSDLWKIVFDIEIEVFGCF